MRTIEGKEIDELLLGCTLLGTGGGGDLKEGLKMLEGRTLKLCTLEELDPADMASSPYVVGSLGGRFEPKDCVEAFKLLEKRVNKCFSAAIATELGGSNTAVAFYVASEMGIPVIDGDPAGRAVPECQHTTFFVKNMPMHPFSMAMGDNKIIAEEVKDDFDGERIIRGLVSLFGSNAGVASHPKRVKELKGSLVEGSISLALKAGKALEGKEFMGELKKLGAIPLFRGKAVRKEWREEGGFTLGHYEFVGLEDHRGEYYKLCFKNENMYLCRNDKTLVTVPDLICVLNKEGKPVTNPEVEEGEEYGIIAFPAPEIWRSRRGLELFGPQYLGLNVGYAPVEEICGSW
jgi:hypothetical protein